MKIKELREQTVEELVARSRELKHDMLNMRVQQASGQLENPTRIMMLRRENARIETILSARRLNLVVGKPNAAPKAKKATVTKAPVKKKAPARKKEAPAPAPTE